MALKPYYTKQISLENIKKTSRDYTLYGTLPFRGEEQIIAIVENFKRSHPNRSFRAFLSTPEFSMDIGKDQNRIDLGEYTSIDSAIEAVEEGLLRESPELISKIKEASKTIPIESSNQDIVSMLEEHKTNLIVEVLTRSENRVTAMTNIKSFSVDTNKYGREFFLSVNEKSGGRSRVVVSGVEPVGYDLLEKLTSNECVDSIRRTVEAEKKAIIEHNENGYNRANPYNKIESITMLWSEATRDVNITGSLK